MVTDTTPELERFCRFIADKIANGGAQLSPEKALDEWRAGNPTTEELAADVADLRQALEEADRGDGIPLDQVIEELRQKHQLLPSALDE